MLSRPREPIRQGDRRPGKTFVLYRGSAWRSSLAAATLQDMGLSPVCHIGGFKAWKDAGLPVVDKPRRDKN